MSKIKLTKTEFITLLENISILEFDNIPKNTKCIYRDDSFSSTLIQLDADHVMEIIIDSTYFKKSIGEKLWQN